MFDEEADDEPLTQPQVSDGSVGSWANKGSKTPANTPSGEVS